MPPDETVLDRDHLKCALVSAYNTKLKNEVQEELEEIKRPVRETEPYNKREQRCTIWWNQFTVLLERGLKERKHQSFSSLKITHIIIVSLLGGMIWFQSQGHVQDQMGLIFFHVGLWNYLPIFEALFTFPQEREMLNKERSSRMYRLSSYFVARLVGDLPMELVMPTVSVTITYWMGGLKPTALSYTNFLLITLFSALVSQGLGVAVGAFIMDLKKATTLTSILMGLFMMLGGLYVQKIPPFVAWVKYVSICFHMFKLLLHTQLTPADTYECAPDQRCSVTNLPPVKVVGFEHKEFDIIIMFVMLVFFRFLAYMSLRRIGVPD